MLRFVKSLNIEWARFTSLNCRWTITNGRKNDWESAPAAKSNQILLYRMHLDCPDSCLDGIWALTFDRFSWFRRVLLSSPNLMSRTMCRRMCCRIGIGTKMIMSQNQYNRLPVCRVVHCYRIELCLFAHQFGFILTRNNYVRTHGHDKAYTKTFCLFFFLENRWAPLQWHESYSYTDTQYINKQLFEINVFTTWQTPTLLRPIISVCVYRVYFALSLSSLWICQQQWRPQCDCSDFADRIECENDIIPKCIGSGADIFEISGMFGLSRYHVIPDTTSIDSYLFRVYFWSQTNTDTYAASEWIEQKPVWILIHRNLRKIAAIVTTLNINNVLRMIKIKIQKTIESVAMCIVMTVWHMFDS